MEPFNSIMCRVCENQSNLLDISISTNQNYVEQFLICANVSFDANDQLPHFLCQLCATRLTAAYEFKEQCEQTQKKLQDLLKEFNDKLFKNNVSNDDELTEESINDETFYDYGDEQEYYNENEENDTKTCKTKIANNKFKKTKLKNRHFGPTCDICKKTLKTKAGIELHMKLKHNMAQNLKQCPYCEKWFNNRKYPIHIDSHEKPYKCEQCLKNFSTDKNLRRHINDIHDQLKQFECTLCGYRFKQNSALQLHISHVHLNESNFHCSKCDKSYKTKILLNNHEISHLSIEEQEKFKAKQQQRKPVYRSSNGRKYVCQYCGKITFNPASHFAHVETHNQGREYGCDICGKNFKTRMVLYSHKRTHSTEKPYQCDVCDLKFLLKTHWQSHQRVHTGEKPFKCEYCGKEFATKGNCMTHRRLHTGEKPFNCQQCTESFLDLNGLKRHRKKVHEV